MEVLPKLAAGVMRLLKFGGQPDEEEPEEGVASEEMLCMLLRCFQDEAAAPEVRGAALDALAHYELESIQEYFQESDLADLLLGCHDSMSEQAGGLLSTMLSSELGRGRNGGDTGSQNAASPLAAPCDTLHSALDGLYSSSSAVTRRAVTAGWLWGSTVTLQSKSSKTTNSSTKFAIQLQRTLDELVAELSAPEPVQGVSAVLVAYQLAQGWTGFMSTLLRVCVRRSSCIPCRCCEGSSR
eukprot:TRINITY_DN15412_c0_g1_i1.p1 TRINITY_DN15412_c0_g1~~TRINITY_DN15412_c0_g1_i1.p1  ORF type:complete len:240 (+),score=50.89 TRINITY_DN15412_c0_g1_i1:241-960(+)